MNPALRNWREAATLILAASRRRRADTLPSRTPPPSGPGSPEDRSHGRTHLPHPSRFDYDVLLLKRSGKSGFMPNAYVFPGGLADPSDFSSEWLDIFKPFATSPGFGLRRVRQPPETRPPIFATDRLKLGSPIPGEVAFRICALRETFEESGVLLVVSKPESRHEGAEPGPGPEPADQVLHDAVNPICSSELVKWRALVNQNPSNFIRMCRELEVVPNIWALHEWGNWLTPTGQYKGRYDTAFFICCLKEIPHTVQDEKEIVRFQWSSPSQILQSYRAQEFWIAPPQFYELGRMCRFPLLQDLHHFSSQRAVEGCDQWLPVLAKDKDGRRLSLLPGDKLYPLVAAGEAEVDTSTDPQDDTPLHRFLITDRYSLTVQISITPKYNHLVPVVEQGLPHDIKSPL